MRLPFQIQGTAAIRAGVIPTGRADPDRLKAGHGRKDRLPPCKEKGQGLGGAKREVGGSSSRGRGCWEGWTGWELSPFPTPTVTLSPCPPVTSTSGLHPILGTPDLSLCSAPPSPAQETSKQMEGGWRSRGSEARRPPGSTEGPRKKAQWVVPPPALSGHPEPGPPPTRGAAGPSLSLSASVY